MDDSSSCSSDGSEVLEVEDFLSAENPEQPPPASAPPSGPGGPDAGRFGMSGHADDMSDDDDSSDLSEAGELEDFTDEPSAVPGHGTGGSSNFSSMGSKGGTGDEDAPGLGARSDRSSGSLAGASASVRSASVVEQLDWFAVMQNAFTDASLSVEQTELFVGAMNAHDYQDGDFIVRQGDVGDAFFIIESGCVSVEEAPKGSKERRGDVQGAFGAAGSSGAGAGAASGAGIDEPEEPPRVLAKLYPGHHFGELSVLSRQNRVASVVARGGPVRCRVMCKSDFDAFAPPHRKAFTGVIESLVAETKRKRTNRSLVKASDRTAQLRFVEQQRRDFKVVNTMNERRTGERQQMINEFLVLRKLGQGSFGTVKLAKNMETSEVVALKVINKSKLRKRRLGITDEELMREVDVMRRLRNEHVVAMREAINDESHDLLIFVEEYMAMGPVMEEAESCEPLDEALSRVYFRSVLRGLEYLHFQRVVHRDIKPANILVSESGEAKLADFGVAAVLPEGSTCLRDVQGTPAFMAPELFGDIDEYDGFAVDIWALGATLFNLVTGRPPFLASNQMELAEKLRTEGPDYPRGMNPHLRHLVGSMLERDVDKRASLSTIMRHDWVTIEGTDPMPPIRYVRVKPAEAAPALRGLRVKNVTVAVAGPASPAGDSASPAGGSVSRGGSKRRLPRRVRRSSLAGMSAEDAAVCGASAAANSGPERLASPTAAPSGSRRHPSSDHRARAAGPSVAAQARNIPGIATSGSSLSRRASVPVMDSPRSSTGNIKAATPSGSVAVLLSSPGTPETKPPQAPVASSGPLPDAPTRTRSSTSLTAMRSSRSGILARQREIESAARKAHLQQLRRRQVQLLRGHKGLSGADRDLMMEQQRIPIHASRAEIAFESIEIFSGGDTAHSTPPRAHQAGDGHLPGSTESSPEGPVAATGVVPDAAASALTSSGAVNPHGLAVGGGRAMAVSTGRGGLLLPSPSAGRGRGVPPRSPASIGSDSGTGSQASRGRGPPVIAPDVHSSRPGPSGLPSPSASQMRFMFGRQASSSSVADVTAPDSDCDMSDELEQHSFSRPSSSNSRRLPVDLRPEGAVSVRFPAPSPEPSLGPRGEISPDLGRALYGVYSPGMLRSLSRRSSLRVASGGLSSPAAVGSPLMQRKASRLATAAASHAFVLAPPPPPPSGYAASESSAGSEVGVTHHVSASDFGPSDLTPSRQAQAQGSRRGQLTDLVVAVSDSPSHIAGAAPSAGTCFAAAQPAGDSPAQQAGAETVLADSLSSPAGRASPDRRPHTPRMRTALSRSSSSSDLAKPSLTMQMTARDHGLVVQATTPNRSWLLQTWGSSNPGYPSPSGVAGAARVTPRAAGAATSSGFAIGIASPSPAAAKHGAEGGLGSGASACRTSTSGGTSSSEGPGSVLPGLSLRIDPRIAVSGSLGRGGALAASVGGSPSHPLPPRGPRLRAVSAAAAPTQSPRPAAAPYLAVDTATAAAAAAAAASGAEPKDSCASAAPPAAAPAPLNLTLTDEHERVSGSRRIRRRSEGMPPLPAAVVAVLAEGSPEAAAAASMGSVTPALVAYASAPVPAAGDDAEPPAVSDASPPPPPRLTASQSMSIDMESAPRRTLRRANDFVMVTEKIGGDASGGFVKKAVIFHSKETSLSLATTNRDVVSMKSLKRSSSRGKNALKLRVGEADLPVSKSRGGSAAAAGPSISTGAPATHPRGLASVAEAADEAETPSAGDRLGRGLGGGRGGLMRGSLARRPGLASGQGGGGGGAAGVLASTSEDSGDSDDSDSELGSDVSSLDSDMEDMLGAADVTDDLDAALGELMEAPREDADVAAMDDIKEDEESGSDKAESVGSDVGEAVEYVDSDEEGEEKAAAVPGPRRHSGAACSFVRLVPVPAALPGGVRVSRRWPGVMQLEGTEDHLNTRLDLRFGAAADQGQREGMEDRLMAVADMAATLGLDDDDETTPQAYFGVYDGHSGERTSQMLMERLHLAVLERLREVDDPGRALTEAFTATDQAWVNSQVEAHEADSTYTLDGSTAVVAVVREEEIIVVDDDDIVIRADTPRCGAQTGAAAAASGAGGEEPETRRVRLLYVANAGDCRAVLCRGGWARDMSVDHKASLDRERERVEAAGGTVHNGRVNGVIAVTRAFGDPEFKALMDKTWWGNGAKADILTATPDIRSQEITAYDEFVILACDGLWDVMTSQQAVNFVRRRLRESPDLQAATEALVAKAIELASVDNVSAIVVALNQQVSESTPSMMRAKSR